MEDHGYNLEGHKLEKKLKADEAGLHQQDIRNFKLLNPHAAAGYILLSVRVEYVRVWKHMCSKLWPGLEVPRARRATICSKKVVARQKAMGRHDVEDVRCEASQ